MSEILPEVSALPGLGALLAGAVLGGLLHVLGGEQGRSWAAPAGAFVVFLGLDRFYTVPAWVLVGGFLATTALVGTLLRRRQSAAALKHDFLEVPGTGIKLQRRPDYSGRSVGVWACAPDQGPAAPVWFKPPAPEEPLQAPEAPPLYFSLALRVEGVGQDEQRVVLCGELPVGRPGELVAFCEGAAEPGVMAAEESLSGLPGQPYGMRLRARPADFAFELLDVAALAALQDILSLRTPRRELYVRLSGPKLEVIARSGYDELELRTLLCGAARLLKRLDEFSRLPRD